MMLFAVACSNGSAIVSAPISIPTAQGVAVTSPPVLAGRVSPVGDILVGEVTFTHSGFQTQVTKALPFEAALEEGHVATVELSLQNLSQPSGSMRTRATINFDRTIDNYVELPTKGGPLRLYLHRDGTLRSESDPGGFT
jgi:hypothetical protein